MTFRCPKCGGDARLGSTATDGHRADIYWQRDGLKIVVTCPNATYRLVVQLQPGDIPPEMMA